MKATDLKKKCTEITAELIQAVKSAKNDEQIIQYLDFCSRFHNYSLHNRFLIWAHNPEATLAAGFRAWQKVGRHVKRGEKGIPILAPMTVKVKKEEPRDPEDLEDVMEDETSRKPEVVIRFKVVYVFDVSQTEGKPLPETPDTMVVAGDASHLLPALEGAVRSAGIQLDYVDDLGRAAGVSSKGKIMLRSSMDTPQRFSVLAHEFAHELLHGKRERGNPPRKITELEAEATAYVVLKHFGLEGKAPEYLAIYRVEEVDIIASLDRIVSTASKIIRTTEAGLKQALEPDEDPGGYGDIGRWRKAVGC